MAPVSRLPAFVAACTAAALITASAAAAPAPRVVGGSTVPITAVPWQVLVHHVVGNQGLLCGGAIIDSTHVVTAAHCVTNNLEKPGSPASPPGNFTVTAGTAHVSDPFSSPPGPGADPTASTVGVSAVAKDARYDGADFDTAVLTLSPALVLDGSSRRAIPLGTSTPPPGAAVTISGWGSASTSDSTPSPDLRRATVNVVDFATCNAEYDGDFKSASVVCAVAPGSDACEGDSGGPLVDGAGTLVGIASSGPLGTCAVQNEPGVYTNVSDCRVRSFITTQVNGPGPQPCTEPSISGVAGPPGQVLTCSPGSWTGTPVFTFDFVDQGSGAILQSGPATTFTVTDADIGRSILCHVVATDPSGTQSAQTAAIGPIAAPPDTTAPRATFTDAKCTRTRCVLHIQVTDAPYSSGIASVKVTRRTTVSRSCVVRGRRKTCHRTSFKTLTALKLSGNRYKITAGGLPKAVTRFSARATDNKGNVQGRASFVTRHTPPL